MLPKGTLEILAMLENGPRYFNELARIKVGSKPINRRTLASRLRMLEREELVIRVVDNSRPPRVRYELTNRGRMFLGFLKP